MDAITNTLTEAELIKLLKKKGVKKFNIVQMENTTYGIVINSTTTGVGWELITPLGRPRFWASLDRLIYHIQATYTVGMPPITLTLFKKY